MLRIYSIWLLAGAVFILFGSSSVFAEEKNILVEAKCNKCHDISVLKIKKKNKKSKAPDISDAGKLHDAEFYKAYLRKEIAHAPHEGNDSKKKHKGKLKATGEKFDKIIKATMDLKGES